MAIGAVVGGVVISIVVVGYGVVRIAVASCTAFDTYGNEDDTDFEEEDGEEDEG